MKPSISIIIPVLNRENLIVRCLESVIHQTLLPMELIVVDNGSNDRTYEVVEEWFKKNKDSGIKFHLLTEEKRGATLARNRGLKEAGGDYVYFFDSDDEMRPSLIEKATETIKQFPDADLICWRCEINDLKGKKKIPHYDPSHPIENHLIHTLLKTPAYLTRKEFLIEAGGWNESLKVWDDFEFGLRLLLNSPKIYSLRNILVDIYSQVESITGIDFSSRAGVWEESLNEMRKRNENRNHPQKKEIDKILNYRNVLLASFYLREGNKKRASNLMDEALENLNIKERMLLKFSYYYTAFGLRGAWRIIRGFYL